jgi:hypothetical protein
MEYELDRDIAVEPVGPGEYAASLRDGWQVGAGVNGGYLLALIGGAVRTHLTERGHTDPVTLSAYYLTPSVAGPARVRVRELRASARRATVAASLVQDLDGTEVERISVLATYAAPEDAVPEVERQQPVPQIPPVEDCIDLVEHAPDPAQIPPLMRRFGTRLDPACVGWALGKPSGEGVIQGWFRLADDRPLDPIALLLVVDALPPATFDLGRMGWAPTLELTAHVRARPATGWAVVRHETRNVSGGYFEEDCAVWDSAGRLVAQSRQLALLPR